MLPSSPRAALGFSATVKGVLTEHMVADGTIYNGWDPICDFVAKCLYFCSLSHPVTLFPTRGCVFFYKANRVYVDIIFDKTVGNVSLLTKIVTVFAQVEFQDQSQQMLKPSEIYQLDQELPKRVRARLVSTFCFRLCTHNIE